MIKKELHIYCDKCGAEGPHVIGEKRPSLLAEIKALGWKITDACQHLCMECANPKVQVHVTQIEHHLPDGRVETVVADVKINDRSVHWTEARKMSHE